MQPETIFLHVREDGREQVFTAQPSDIEVLRVERTRRSERTFTSVIEVDGDRRLVKPRGKGWAYVGLTDIWWGKAVWQRSS
jgi:hypothetical protein